MATTRLYAPRPYDEFDSGVAGVAPILSTGTDVDNTKITAVQAAATASGIGTLPTSAGGTSPAPVAEPLRFRGPWQISTVYSYGDVVSQGGSLYVAPSAFTSGSSFVAGNWTKLGPYDATDPSFSTTYEATAGAANGADDTAAIQALLTAARTAGGGRVRGLPGQAYKISAPLVIGSGTTLDMTGCTVTLIAGSNCNMINNYGVSSGVRDTGVAVIGGTWARGANAGAGTALHTLRFRKVDGLTIRDLTVTSSAGKYAVNPGDVTQFLIENVTFATFSDGVHVNGPASSGTIRDIFGTTGDDSVAFTGNDYAAYNDTTGDITAVSVDRVRTTSTNAALVKVIAGSGCAVDAVTVRDVRGTSGARGVWIGDDTGSANTTGGTYGAVTVDGVSIAYPAASSAVYLNALTANRVKVSRIKGAAQTNTPLIDVAGASAIGQLTIEDATIVPAAVTGWNLLRLNGTGTIEELTVTRPHIVGAATTAIPFLVNSTTVRAFVLDGLTCPDLAVNQTTIQLNNGAIVRQLTVRGADVRYGDTSTCNFLVPIAGSTLSQVVITESYFFQGRDLISSNTGGSTVHVSIDNTYIDAMNRLANLLSTVEFYLGSGLTVDTLVNAAIFLGTGATTVVRGGPIRTIGTFTLLQRSATQTMQVVGPALKADISTLQRNQGDMAHNTNGALAPVTGTAAGLVGVCVCDGTTWKQLVSGSTF